MPVLGRRGITLGMTATGSTLLSTDGTVGLQVSVTRCTGGAWTPGTGVCSGVAATPVTTSVSALAATLTVTAATYTASNSNGLVTVKIEACNAGWNETANSCGGLTTTVVDTAVSATASAAFSTSSSLPFGPDLHVRLRATPSIGGLTGTTLTVAVSVARNQARAATVTDS